MKITTVGWSQTQNLGNYNSVKVDATVELTEDDEPEEGIGLVRVFVQTHIREEENRIGDGPSMMPARTDQQDGFESEPSDEPLNEGATEVAW